ncbi:hypothetical protein AB6D34_14025 [Pectobacterium brasiliense]|uniref:YobI-like P-loop NTPase domain-containing protein n=1 Tax=Pectobacterium brasiliense TaxID=180957 RepID=A0A433N9W9_9GAMM|nr:MULTISPECIES: hypothetical protein [Pectobacterium]GKW27539.1 hypothetical protein PEC331060_07170 [Pectobacterium carotovorum subsp. carotovorum]MBN3048956.1 hypothetical protein [Pectobacterium brasiliense]MBN3077317.1 hypothetical protein [Pectobacterium brasiliense]MBN3085059.1 hypothetical protein [Pectobacterium brasiliense]MBN3090830.1 hypothetical protein [Pectobacterium brasiliense]
MIMHSPWLTLSSSDDDSSETSAVGYEALTPTELDSEKASSYINALNYAYNHPDIRNVAVTGPYGAGKSSVLKTWCKTKEATLRVLTVSLADFDMQNSQRDNKKDDDDGNESGVKKDIATTEKSIEYSILQQILYKNKKDELPYSRIERISGVTEWQVAKSASTLTCIFSMVALSLFCLVPDYVTAKLSLPEILSSYLFEHPFVVRLPGVLLSLAGALYLILGQLHRIGIFDKKISLDKIDILKGAVSTKTSSPSLLNIYIDEIVYFFDSTKYDIVIFEDLDRLNNNRIFIKLREINQIINNCLTNRRPLKFIYAVKDDLFNSAESRTKFFDFVMPVIPVMDNENAPEHFSNKFTKEEKSQGGLAECISRIATFIPDMRVMHNITNEFRLYQNIVNNRENLPKLLAMIAYKNLCSEDYHGIDKKQGVIFNFMNAHVERRIQENRLSELEQQIAQEKERMGKIDNENNLSKSSLRKELLSPYINDYYKDALQFYHNGSFWSLNQVVDDENTFLSILNDSGIQTFHQTSRNMILTTGVSECRQLRTTYEDRCKLVDERIGDGLERITNNIITLEASRRKIKNESVADTANYMRKTEFIAWVKIHVNNVQDLKRSIEEQLDFIYFLLSSGYVSTDYMSFRSIFLPGGLSESDNIFIKSVMAGNDAVDTFPLHPENIENVVTRLKKLGVIERENAQHPAVTHWLLDNDPVTLAENTTVLLSQTDSKRVISLLQFIQQDFSINTRFRYLEIFMSREFLLKSLLNHMYNSGNIPVMQDMLVWLLCLNKNRHIWQSPDIFSLTGKLIGLLPKLITSVPDGYGAEFFLTIKNAGLLVSHIPLITSGENHELLNLIVRDGLFYFSPSNLKSIYFSLSPDDKGDSYQFSKSPLHSLESLQTPALMKVIHENIDEFISSTFISSTEFERIPELLNLATVSLNTAELLIERMTFQIENLETIINRHDAPEETTPSKIRNLYTMLIQKDRIAPTMANLTHLLHDNYLDTGNEVVQWANDNHNKMLPSEIIFSSSLGLGNFLVKFIGSPDLREDTLSILMGRFDIYFTRIPKTIPLRNAELLCSGKKLAPILDVFTGLYNALHSNKNNIQRMNTLLCNLIAQRPALLLEIPDEVFYVGKQFDAVLARELFNGQDIDINLKIQALRWLRDEDPSILDNCTLLSLHTLAELTPWMDDDLLRLSLLKRYLSNIDNNVDIDKEKLQLVLDSFSDDRYHGLLPRERFRKIPFTHELWAVAELLSEVGLIHSPKIGSGRDAQKIVITPPRHHSEDDSEE